MFLETEVYIIYHLNYPFQHKYRDPQKNSNRFYSQWVFATKKNSIKFKTLPQAHTNGFCKIEIYFQQLPTFTI